MFPDNFIKQLALNSYQNRHLIEHIGLINGKMGLCINLYHIGKYLDDESVTTLADDMVDEIYTGLAQDGAVPWQLGNGISGLGWGIEHLVQGGFIQGETNDALAEIDNRIFLQKVFGVNMDIAVAEGFLGIGFYFLKRLQNSGATDEDVNILSMKQHTIGIIEQLDYFRIREKDFPVGYLDTQQYWALPMIAHFLYEVYHQDLFNSRVHKILSWFAGIMAAVKPESAVANLSLALSAHLISPLISEDEVIPVLNKLEGISKESVLAEIRQDNVLSPLDILKTYHTLAAGSNNAHLIEALAGWQKEVADHLCASSGLHEMPPYITAKAFGLLDGFNGFYKVLAAITQSRYWKTMPVV